MNDKHEQQPPDALSLPSDPHPTNQPGMASGPETTPSSVQGGAPSNESDGAGTSTASSPQPAAPPLQQVWVAKARVYVDRGSQATGLDPLTFIPVASGMCALALLFIVTLFSWYSYRQTMTLGGTPITQGEWYRGISYAEGKWVFVGAMAAGVWVALGIIKKTWLPGGLLTAGAVGTFAAVVMFALRSRLATTFDAAKTEMKQVETFMAVNPMAKIGAEAMEQTGFSMPTLRGGPSWALAFGILLAIGVAVAFLLASLRRPQSIAFFQKPGTPPLVQKYGLVGAAYGAAFLFGLVFAVIRY